MTNDTDDSFPLQSPPDDNGNPAMTTYGALSWRCYHNDGDRVGDDDLAMTEIEISVAKGILRWFDQHPEQARLRRLIQAVPHHDAYVTLKMTELVRYNLWLRMDASSWLAKTDAKTYSAALWQLAIIRLSAYLNTGYWEIDLEAQAKVI
jgi:hypothetical protein